MLNLELAPIWKGQTYSWVGPLGTSHFKFLWLNQYQNNIKLQTFSLRFISKDYLGRINFEILIKFFKNKIYYF